MEYAVLAAVFEELEATQADTEKRERLAALFADADDLATVVRLSRGRVFARHTSRDLGVSSSLTREAIKKATGVAGARIEEWWKETGDLGSAAERAVAAAPQQTLLSEPLTVERVHATLRDLADYTGEGSQSRKIDAVAGLVADADPLPARYVVRTALGHLRIGVGDGTVREALAAAFDVPADAVERAHQLTNDLPLVATTAHDEGAGGLRALDVALFRPVEAMLARSADDLPAALADVGPGETAYAEYKYDGARVQVHVDGEDVRLFTRRLEDVTAQFPDAVAAVRTGVTAKRCILDGELVGYDAETGAVVPFQRFSKRIKRKYNVEVLAEEIPVTLHLFDCLHDGASLLDAPLSDRLERLDAVIDPGERIERAAHAQPAASDEAAAFYRAALDGGHEGLMIKNPRAPYTPGRRVDTMAKVKPTMEPLELVVTRATYSEGRRSEQLGRLYLACYDRAADRFREVGRLSTGYTDEELAALTDRLEPLVRERDGRDVNLDPEVVVEVEYEEIQSSTEYGSGYALRFPRFLGVREDLPPTDADSHERVEDLYEGQR
jgi:DNA ligase-1